MKAGSTADPRRCYLCCWNRLCSHTDDGSGYERDIGRGAPGTHRIVGLDLELQQRKRLLFFGRHKSQLRQMDTVALKY